MSTNGSDDPTQDPSAQDAQEQNNDGQPPIAIVAQYTKDLSFEAPNSPAIFEHLRTNMPEVNLGADVGVEKAGDLFEVKLKLRAEAKSDAGVAFIAELEYAGLFNINVAPEHVQPVLLIECPRILFPFARAIIADVSRDGGFAPLMLQPMDFAGMFQQRMEALQKDAAQEAEAETETETEADDETDSE